jgi:hypothetical protein
MVASSVSPSELPGTPGIDIFKFAKETKSGYVCSRKTGVPDKIRMPYMSTQEESLSLYLEYHPHVRSYQRGDVSEVFAKAFNVPVPLGTPYGIKYDYDGKTHTYLPDYVGTLINGGLLIAEAGIESEKSKGRAIAKAEAARRIAKLNNGVYWIGTEKNLSRSRYYNLHYLHIRRPSFATYKDIAPVLQANWPWGEHRTVRDFLRLLSGRWTDEEVEAAVWKMAADAAAEGRLLVDLTAVELTLSTELALLDPSLPPLLPDPLPDSLEEAEQSLPDLLSTNEQDGDEAFELQAVIPGPTFDASSLKKKEDRDRFNRNLKAVEAVLGGESVGRVAEKNKMAKGTLSRLLKRVKEFGQIACVPHRTYHRDRKLRPEFQALIRKLYTQPVRPTIQAIYEDVALQKLATKLSAKEGKAVKTPSYDQVYDFIRSISDEKTVYDARSGLKHPQRESMGQYSYVLSIPAPALICQVDEHTLDQLIVAQDGTVITRRVHAAVLVCVKTAAILGAVLALDSLKEEDYMRLIKQALEKKDDLVAFYGCKNRWPCYGKPAIILHDRGKIFVSERATQVLVDRLGITMEKAPAYAPSAKGTVEAIFTWTTRKFEHRLPGTTKSTPEDRGAYDSAREAQKAGITLDVLEKYFIQAIVDGYMQDWNELRRQTPIALWEAAVREKGVARWIGSQDDLKLLLMKAVNRKNPETGRYALKPNEGLSFQGYRYSSPLLKQLQGKEIDIYYDRRDISVIYLFLEGEYVGEAYGREFMGRRVSYWEAKATRKADAIKKKAANAKSLQGIQDVQQSARAGRKAQQEESRRLEQQMHLDRQRHEIHPEVVQATLDALNQAHQQDTSPSSTPLGLLPLEEPEEVTGAQVVHLPIRKLKDRYD